MSLEANTIKIIKTMLISSCIYLSIAIVIRAQMEGFIVGGSFAKIKKVPYAAYLAISCSIDNGKSSWACGSSILNQRLLLTAAHCLAACNTKTNIIIRLGHENNDNGTLRSSSGFLLHSNYDDVTCACDVALVRMSRPVKFNSRINRVAIMEMPPYSEKANVAGWGLTNEMSTIFDKRLKKLDQKVWKYTLCQQTFDDMPNGTICASSYNSESFVAQGDSGAGLVVRNYIQIGVVSYKMPDVAKNVIIYTDVGYFYRWMTYSARTLYCYID